MRSHLVRELVDFRQAADEPQQARTRRGESRPVRDRTRRGGVEFGNLAAVQAPVRTRGDRIHDHIHGDHEEVGAQTGPPFQIEADLCSDVRREVPRRLLRGVTDDVPKNGFLERRRAQVVVETSYLLAVQLADQVVGNRHRRQGPCAFAERQALLMRLRQPEELFSGLADSAADSRFDPCHRSIMPQGDSRSRRGSVKLESVPAAIVRISTDI
ncbi:hypothetical protein ACQPZF_17115 [Actinosynnema sp. CS-041913]|uniref:hypothetical protein n=1 Tax=Actinosynnema sp. CS-041913 TaxID=3239917 RepID=UPI003D91A08C